MDKWDRKKPVARTWGSNRISNCDHDVVNKNGVMYCKKCGRNFDESDLMSQGYYELSDDQMAQPRFDRMIDDIMPQMADELDLEEQNERTRGKGRPKKNPFTFAGDFL